MASLAQRFVALFRQRCPRCLQGKVFRGVITMNEVCPACGHKFEREEGYFLGAMYASYFLSIPLMLLLTGAVYLLRPDWRLELDMAIAVGIYLLLVPLVFRYSRVIWMHMDPPSE